MRATLIVVCMIGVRTSSFAIDDRKVEAHSLVIEIIDQILSQTHDGEEIIKKLGDGWKAKLSLKLKEELEVKLQSRKEVTREGKIVGLLLDLETDLEFEITSAEWPWPLCLLLPLGCASVGAFEGIWERVGSQPEGLGASLSVRGTEVRLFERKDGQLKSWTTQAQPYMDLTIHEAKASTLVGSYKEDARDALFVMNLEDKDSLHVQYFITESGKQPYAAYSKFHRKASRAKNGNTEAPPPSAVPQFPWPPPKWSSRYVIPSGLVTIGKPEELGTIFDRISEALRRGMIKEHSVYAISDGFVVVCRLESINDDGKAKAEPERWSIEEPREGLHSLTAYLRALFSARPGRYRVVALAVTSQVIVAGSQEPTPGEANLWLKQGAGTLPIQLRNNMLSEGGKCEALIYEFHRKSADDSPQLVEMSLIPPQSHLVGAGLWTIEQVTR